MTRKTNSTRKARKTRNRKPLNLKNLRTMWRKANPIARIGMVATATVAAIAAIAIIVGAVRFIGWRVQVNEALTAQSQSQSQYDFNPGNIISDGTFFNGNALSEQQVSTIIEQQGVACSGERCLKSMTFSTESQSADECGISQKVLLTVLQKEQHLLTATNPNDFQFKAAMGLSCPDDANCDPTYAGFFKQVYGAAKRYQYYLRHEGRYGYHAGRLNYIQYNPNASCGGSNVYIENRATALLYIYTPYQPNAAALEAGAGEGDSCSSYGNRNFAIIYHSMFGSPRG